MRPLKSAICCVAIALVFLAVCGTGNTVKAIRSDFDSAISTTSQAGKSLCNSDEQVVFSCPVKLSGKTVSLCSSIGLTKTSGYILYRFGLPGKIELEFPQNKVNTQKSFYYAHYFRPRVDRTEISFNSGDYNYRIFDYYDGESRHSSQSQGLIVTPPGTARASTTLECASAAKADYGALDDALPCDPDSRMFPDGCP